MRVVIDVNILISFLLGPESLAPPTRVVRLALDGFYRLLVPAEAFAELRDKVSTKPYLAARIRPSDAEELVAALLQIGETLTPLPGPIPTVSRDAKDDYLLAHADRANADVLVTGDEDLLVLGFYKGIWIMSPAEFVAEIETRPAP